jgi:hypothetical protein
MNVRIETSYATSLEIKSKLKNRELDLVAFELSYCTVEKVRKEIPDISLTKRLKLN